MTLKLVVWDVKHGSAAYVQTPNKKHIAVDLGARTANSEGFSPLEHLKRNGVPQLDLVVITHPHLDHIEDILNFDKLSPRLLVRPRHLTEKEIWAGNKKASLETRRIIRKYIEINRRYTSPVNPQDDPTASANNGGVSFRFFRPSGSSRVNLNNHSVVTTVEYNGIKILLPGDNESESWSELLECPDFKDAISGTHVLFAPHHGRKSGFHSELFKYFNPLITIISDGRFLETSATNRYAKITQGWNVKKRSGGWATRKCVTTRNDGVIRVDIGGRLSKSPLGVTID